MKHVKTFAKKVLASTLSFTLAFGGPTVTLSVVTTLVPETAQAVSNQYADGRAFDLARIAAAEPECDNFCAVLFSFDKKSGKKRAKNLSGGVGDWSEADDQWCADHAVGTNPGVVANPNAGTSNIPCNIPLRAGDTSCQEANRRMQHCKLKGSQIETQCGSYVAQADATKGEKIVLALDTTAAATCGLACAGQVIPGAQAALITACKYAGATASTAQLIQTIASSRSRVQKYIGIAGGLLGMGASFGGIISGFKGAKAPGAKDVKIARVRAPAAAGPGGLPISNPGSCDQNSIPRTREVTVPPVTIMSPTRREEFWDGRDNLWRPYPPVPRGMPTAGWVYRAGERVKVPLTTKFNLETRRWLSYTSEGQVVLHTDQIAPGPGQLGNYVVVPRGQTVQQFQARLRSGELPPLPPAPPRAANAPIKQSELPAEPLPWTNVNGRTIRYVQVDPGNGTPYFQDRDGRFFTSRGEPYSPTEPPFRYRSPGSVEGSGLPDSGSPNKYSGAGSRPPLSSAEPAGPRVPKTSPQVAQPSSSTTTAPPPVQPAGTTTVGTSPGQGVSFPLKPGSVFQPSAGSPLAKPAPASPSYLDPNYKPKNAFDNVKFGDTTLPSTTQPPTPTAAGTTTGSNNSNLFGVGVNKPAPNYFDPNYQPKNPLGGVKFGDSQASLAPASGTGTTATPAAPAERSSNPFSPNYRPKNPLGNAKFGEVDPALRTGQAPEGLTTEPGAAQPAAPSAPEVSETTANSGGPEVANTEPQPRTEGAARQEGGGGGSSPRPAAQAEGDCGKGMVAKKNGKCELAGRGEACRAAVMFGIMTGIRAYNMKQNTQSKKKTCSQIKELISTSLAAGFAPLSGTAAANTGSSSGSGQSNSSSSSGTVSTNTSSNPGVTTMTANLSGSAGNPGASTPTTSTSTSTSGTNPNTVRTSVIPMTPQQEFTSCMGDAACVDRQLAARGNSLAATDAGMLRMSGLSKLLAGPASRLPMDRFEKHLAGGGSADALIGTALGGQGGQFGQILGKIAQETERAGDGFNLSVPTLMPMPMAQNSGGGEEPHLMTETQLGTPGSASFDRMPASADLGKACDPSDIWHSRCQGQPTIFEIVSDRYSQTHDRVERLGWALDINQMLATQPTRKKRK